MKRTALLLLSVIFLVPFGFARAQNAPGCGPGNIKFDAKTVGKGHTLPAAPRGKALVVFLQDDLRFRPRPRPTTRFAIDGTWVGATHANSFFYVAVDPGVHNVCANWQSIVPVGYPVQSTAATVLTAAPGNIYFLRAIDIGSSETGTHGYHSFAAVRLERVDNAEGFALLPSFALSRSHPKK